MDWQPLRRLREQLDRNVAALRSRGERAFAELGERLSAFAPAREFFIAVEADRVHLARDVTGAIEPLANPVTAAGAAQISAKLFPAGKCTEPVLVAGLDQGWLWSALYRLPCHTPAAPGHTPPLYFLTRDLERLWAVLHVHDWRDALADPRVRLFAGEDAIEQAQQSMAAHLAIPIPKLCVTVDPTTWTNGATIDSVTMFALRSASARMQHLTEQLSRDAMAKTPSRAFAEADQPLRVMGITSRYTTFLQYSMRDWLEAFAAVGHETHLVIEPDNCAQANPILFAEACAKFRPDLIVMIDHYRGEYAGLPKDVPFVMWIQDQLPNMFRPQAGAAQQRLDYTIGYGRTTCVYEHGYPGDRFLPVMIGTNEKRFQPRRLTHEEHARHSCDVSFVSHCSTPADVMLQEEIARLGGSIETRRVLERTYEKLRARYDAGQAVTIPLEMRGMVESSLSELKLNVDRPDTLLSIFTHKINNALFRHQSLSWLIELADREGLRINLYGRGWEHHPSFARFARGPADNETELSAIYQASKINLQISPFGAAHQRVYDGCCAGGFFLLRAVPGDQCHRIYRDLWNWIASRSTSVMNDAHLRTLAPEDAQLGSWIHALTALEGRSPFDHGHDLVSELRIDAADGFTGSAATLWDEYDDIAFDSRASLHDLVRRYRQDDARRAQIAQSMRTRTIERMTYRAIADRTIEFIRNDLKDVAAAIAA